LSILMISFFKYVKEGHPKVSLFLLCIVTIIRLIKFLYFLVGKRKENIPKSETFGCDIWILYAKVTKVQNNLVDVLKSFLQQWVLGFSRSTYNEDLLKWPLQTQCDF